MDAMLGPALGAGATLPIGESTLRTLKVQKLDEESVGMKTCRGRVLLQHAGAIAAGNAGTIVGLALGWSAGALEVLHGAQGFPVTLEQWSWVSSLMPIGAAVGALPAGRLVQSLGRKAVILGLGPVTLAAWLLHLWASSVWMLYAGRLLLGAAVGAAIVAAPIFVAEMAQPAIRGALSTYFQVLLCLGILAVYAGGKFLSVRWLNVCCLATSVLHVAGFAWFPDTPRWYLLRGRPGDARKAMLFYRGPDYDVDAELQLVLEGIKAAAVATNGRPRRDSNPETEPLLGRRDNDGWGALASPAARKTMAMCLVLVVLQQITGVNAITFYTTQLFEGAGGMDAYSASIVVASVEVAATVVSMYLVDRAGRRVLLLATGAAMAVCTGLLGLFFFFQEGLRHDMAAVSCAPVILVSVYMFMFACGWGPVTWVFVGEVFPDNVKGVATGLSSTTVWLSAFLVTKFYPGVALALGNFTCYWAFFALCVLACLFVALVLPETKGKSLDEIQALL